MVLSNINFFGWEFPEHIGFHKLGFVNELLWFALALAGVALVVMTVEIVLAVKRYQYEKAFVGNILLAAFSLIFALWTVSCTTLLADQFGLESAVTDLIEYGLFMVAMITFVGYVLYTYFEEVPPACNALLIVTACFAIAAVVMDTFGAMSLAYGAFYMLIFVGIILVVLAILALVRLFITGKSKYVIYLVSLVVLAGACAFNFYNDRTLFAEDYLFDYRIVMDVYLLLIMIIGLVTVSKPEEKDVTIAETQEQEPAPEQPIVSAPTNETVGTAFDATIPAVEANLIEPEIVVEDLTEHTPKAAPVVATVDVTEQEIPQEEKKAVKKPSFSPHYTDFLTEIRNRIFFMEQLAEVQKEGSYESNVAVVVFDVDHLSAINESKGYAVGDQVLRLAATAISTSFGEVGDCARIDGDEFAVIIKDSKPGVISQRLLVMLEAIKNYNEKAEVKVSVSFGYAVYSGKGELNMEALLRMAEKRTESKQ